MLSCQICGTHLYDEFMLIDDRDNQPICLDCDTPEAIADWKAEND